MRKKPRKADVQPSVDPTQGLFRTSLAGPGSTLSDAFAKLEQAERVERIWRHRRRDLFGARITLAKDEGDGYMDFVRVRDDLFVTVENMSYRDPRVERLSGDGLIQFYFKLSGDLTMAMTRAQSLHLNRPSLLIYHHPQGLEISEWLQPSTHERSVCINIRPHALLDWFFQEANSLPAALLALVNNDRGSAIEYCQVSLSAVMFDLSMKLIDNPYSGGMALMYTEAVAIELLCATFAAMHTLPDTPNEQYSHRELRGLQQAREYLMREIANPPTIRSVARAAGMSETTLKRAFRSIFGVTVAEFSVSCRMQHALTLLREQRIPVAQVAEAVGYVHQTSFATAFRRHFGLRPKDLQHGRRPQ